MVSAYATGTRLSLANADENTLVNADISLWSSAFVVLTLVINGPLISPLLGLLKLNVVPAEKMKIRSRAKRALCRFTEQQLNVLRDDDDEFLQGANWDAVAQYVDMSGYLEGFDQPRKGKKLSRQETIMGDTSTGTGVLALVFKAVWRGIVNVCTFWRQPKGESLRSLSMQSPVPPAPKIAFKFARKSSNTNLTASRSPSKASPTSSDAPSPPSGGGGGGAGAGGGGAGGIDDSAVINREGSHAFIAEVHGTWEDLTADELASEMNDECPFLPHDHASAAPQGGDGGATAAGAQGGDGAEGDIEMGLISPSSNEGSHRSLSNLPPITEGKVLTAGQGQGGAADDDQMCLTGAAGAKLLQELKRTMTSEDLNAPSLPPDYYASMPAGVGAKLQQQLAEELAQNNLSATAQQQQAKGIAQEEINPDYYSSLPAMVGRELQKELRKAVAAEGQPSTTAPAVAIPSTAKAPAVKGSGGIMEQPDYYSSLPAAIGRGMREELQRRIAAGEGEQVAAELAASLQRTSYNATAGPSNSFGARSEASISPGASTTSLPAVMGRAMQEELRQRLQRPSARRHGSRGTSTDFSAPGSPKASTGAFPSVLGGPRVSGGRPLDYYSYHTTVSGVSGSNLASELREHMKHVPSLGSERDLLGRKMGGGRTGRETPRGGTDSPRLPPPPPPPAAAAPVGTTRPPLMGPPMLQRSSVGGAHAHVIRSVSMAERAVGPSATPMSAALLEKKKSNLHALRRSATTSDRSGSIGSGAGALSFQHSSSGSLDKLTVGSSDGPSSSKGGVSFASGTTPSKTFRSTRSGIQRGHLDPSASLLARTFSVGDSLHRRGRLDIAVDEEDDKDEEEAVGENGETGMGLRHASATTLRSVSIRKNPEGDSDSEINDEDAEMLAEMRVRVLGGLKRYFVGKRLAGLLSVDGLRILQYACDKSADHANSPLHLWGVLEKEIKGGWMTRLASRLSLLTTRSYRAMSPFFQKALSWPFKKFTGLLRRVLGRKMLVACEVAVEYYLALLWSPQIEFLKTHGDSCWRLLDEVEAENEAAYRFIIEREIEAPDRFQAIQSYRAAMALLRQQMIFVDELFEMGMVDEAEERGLSDPIDRKVRHLELVGPVWRPPRPMNVLRALPFMTALPEAWFRKIYETGSLKEFRKGQCIWTATDLVRNTEGAQGPGGFVVLSGVVKRVYIRRDGGRKEYYQGAGGVVGVLLCLTGTKLPGTEMAIAEGNALGKGPVVFHIPQKAVKQIQIAAEAGDPDMAVLEEELMRLSAAYVVESMEIEVVAAVSLHLELVLSGNSNSSSTSRGGGTRRSDSGGVGLHRVSSVPQTYLSRKSTSEAVLLAAAGPSGDLGAVGLRRTTGAQGSGAVGSSPLVTSKSVGANLAAMMQQIAALEYEEDDEEQDGEEEGEEDLHSAAHDGRPLKKRPAPHVVRSSFDGQSDRHRQGLASGDAAAAAAENGDKSTQQHSHQQQRPASPSRRGVRFSASSPHVSAAPEDAEKTALLVAALQRAPQLAADVVFDIRRALHSAFVLRLEPGSSLWQTSHVVLLVGSLDSVPATESEKPRAFAAPAVVPWLWNERLIASVGGAVPDAEGVDWVVGPKGATVVVAHNADGSVPEGVVEWEERMEEVERERRAAELASFPLSSGNTPLSASMRRSPSMSGSEQGSLTGTAATVMKEQLGAVLGMLKRSVTDTVVRTPRGRPAGQ